MSASTERIRVLRIITRLNVGGPTRHVAILMAGLSASRFEQVLIHGTGPESEGLGVLPVEGSCLSVPSLVREPSPLRDLKARAEIAKIIRDFRPQILHTHQAKAGSLGRSAGARERVPAIVHTYHGHTLTGYFDPVRARIFRWLERRAAKHSQALITQSPSQRRDLAAALGPAHVKKLLVIPPAIPKGFFEPPAQTQAELRAALGLPVAPRLLLLPARLVPIKRPDRAIFVLEELKKFLDVALVVAGDGPWAEDLKSLASGRGLASSVHWLGNVRDMKPLYGAVDLTFLTSRAEGTPLALVESMAMGTPVAAPGVGGVRDIVGEAGLVLEPELSPGAFARALASVLSSPEKLAAFAKRGRVQAQSQHHPDALVASVERLYEDLLSSRKTERG